MEEKKQAATYCLSPAAGIIRPARFWDAGNPETKETWPDKPVRIGGRSGTPRAIVVDFGREVGGHLRVVWGRTGGVTVRFFFSESLEHLYPFGDHVWEPPAVSLLMGKHTYRGRGSAEWKDPLIRGGFRYVLVKPARRSGIEIRDLALEPDFFIPEDGKYAGEFISSDEDLNRIWYSAAYTLQVGTKRPWEGFFTTRDRVGTGEWVITDGAKRDRAVWSLDLVVSIPSFLLSLGEPAVARDSLVSLIEQKDRGLFALRDGYIPHSSFPVTHPVGITNALQTFSNYVLWWIRGAWSYYLYTGDTAFARDMSTHIEDALKWVERRARPSPETSTPLFHADGFNDLSWDYTIHRKGFPGATNLLWAKTLEEAARLARAAGCGDKETEYAGKAADIRRAVFEKGFRPHNLFDHSESRFRHTTRDGPHTTLEVNAMAVLYDFVAGEKAHELLDLLARRLHVEWGSLCSDRRIHGPLVDWHNKKVMPCITSLEVAALMKYARFREALELVKATWLPMLGRGPESTFWEWYGDRGGITNAMASLCHPWSAAILQVLTESITGITPEAGGYSSFRLDPLFAGSGAGPEQVEFRIPTPSGPIKGAWRRRGERTTYEIDCPPGLNGRFVQRQGMVSVRGPRGGKLKNDSISGSGAFTFENLF